MWKKAYQKSSRSSFPVAWKGMFRTRILDVLCFLEVCFFLLDSATPDLQKQQKETAFTRACDYCPLICLLLTLFVKLTKRAHTTEFKSNDITKINLKKKKHWLHIIFCLPL